MPRILTIAGIVASLVLAGGCRLLPKKSASSAQKPPASQPSLAIAQAQIMAFADQYATIMAQQLDDFVAKVNTPQARRQALFRKIEQVNAAFSIATGHSPLVNLLDLVVLVTLNRSAQEEYWVKVYGQAALPLLDTLKQQEADVWLFAGERLTPHQLQQLRDLIQAWRRKNPGQYYISHVRFTQFAAVMAKEQKATAPSDGGSIFSLLALDPLAGLEPAVRQLEETHYLAERALYYGERLPTLLRWQVELMLFEAAQTPEVQQLTSVSERLTRTAEQLPGLLAQQREAAIQQVFDGIARERSNTLASLAFQEQQATNLMANLRTTLVAGMMTADALENVASTSDALLERLQNIRPIDIKEYAAAASEVSTAASQLNALANSTDQSLGRAVSRGKELLTYMLILAVIFVLVVLAALLLYRWLAQLLLAQGRNSP